MEEPEIFRITEEFTLAEQFPLGQGHLQHTAITEHNTKWG